MSSIPEGSSLDHDGKDRQDYEPPNCGSKAPHSQHFHVPAGGLRLNCPGAKAPAHDFNQAYAILMADYGEVFAASMMIMARERGTADGNVILVTRTDDYKYRITPVRRTVTVTHTVDVPAGVTDEQVAETFADMRIQYPALPGWWISYPEAKEKGKGR